MFKKKGSQGSHSTTSHSGSTKHENVHTSNFGSTPYTGFGEGLGISNTIGLNNPFNSVGFTPFNNSSLSNTSFGLSFDIFQEGDEIVVEIPFPRLNAETLSITQESRVIKVSGSTEAERNRNPILIQTPSGYFEQIIQLPVAVHEDETKATYKDGILTINLKPISSGRNNKVNVSFT